MLHYQLCSSVGLGGKTSALGEERKHVLILVRNSSMGREENVYVYVHTQHTCACGPSGGLENLLEGRGGNGDLSREGLIRKG